MAVSSRKRGDSAIRDRVVSASEFKAKCLAMLDDVEAHGRTLVVTKRGRAIARVVPLTGKRTGLEGSLLYEEDTLAPIDVKWEANE